MYSKKKIFFSIIVMFCILTVQTSLKAEDQLLLKTFEAVGNSRIQGTQIADARESAITSALLSCVDRAAIEMITLDVFSRNFSAINEMTAANVKQFVHGYKVLAETRTAGYYKVMVQATLSLDLIQKQFSGAGILAAKNIMPSVFLMVSEQSLDSHIPKYWWAEGASSVKSSTESFLSKSLSEKGFRVAGHEHLDGSDQLLTVLRENPYPENIQAAELGAKMNADIVISGKSIVQRAPNILGTDRKTFKAILSLRVIRSGTGEELAVIEQSALAAGTEGQAAADQAIINAVRTATEELSRQASPVWQKQAKKSSIIEIQVEGANQLKNYSTFRSALNKIEGVKSVQVKEMKANKAILIVDYHQGGKHLADSLILIAFEGFGINIPEVTQNNIKIILIPGQ